MKKYFAIVVLCLLSIFLVSCNKEIEIPPKNEEEKPVVEPEKNINTLDYIYSISLIEELRGLTNEFLSGTDKYHLNMKFSGFNTPYEENYYTEELFTKYEQYNGSITYTYDGIYLQADGNNLYGFATTTEHTFNIFENFNDNFQIYKEDTTYYIKVKLKDIFEVINFPMYIYHYYEEINMTHYMKVVVLEDKIIVDHFNNSGVKFMEYTYLDNHNVSLLNYFKQIYSTDLMYIGLSTPINEWHDVKIHKSDSGRNYIKVELSPGKYYVNSKNVYYTEIYDEEMNKIWVEDGLIIYSLLDNVYAFEVTEDTTYYIMFGSHTWDKSPYSYIIKSLENLDLIEKPFQLGKTNIEVLDIPNGTLITKTFDYDTELIIEYIPTTIEEGYMKVNQTGILPGSLDRAVNIKLKANEELRIEVYGSGELIISQK